MLCMFEIIVVLHWQLGEELCMAMRVSEIIIIFVKNKAFVYLNLEWKKKVLYLAGKSIAI